MSQTVKLQKQLLQLEAEKEMRFQQLQETYDKSQNLDNDLRIRIFKMRLGLLDRCEKEFHQLVKEIVRINVELNSEYAPNFQPLAVADELCAHIRLAAKDLLEPAQRDVKPAPETRNALRLPRIPIPNFDGKLQNWPVFYELFTNLVHENRDLSDTDRIHYLATSLTGSARGVLTGLHAVGSNYSIVWRLLTEKYQNPRVLGNTYLQQMIDFKVATHESEAYLNSFLERFDSAYSALKKLNIPDLADFIVAHIALSKLDSETARAFEIWFQLSEAPEYEDVIKFVKLRAQIVANSSRSNNHSKSSFRSNFSKTTVVDRNTKIPHSFVTNNSNNVLEICIICGNEAHQVYKCPQFLKLSPRERFKLVRGKGLCFNCLSWQHSLPKCASTSTCSTCQQRHHSLIHLTRSSEQDTGSTNCQSPARTKAAEPIDNSSNTAPKPGASLNFCNTNIISNRTVLLSTAVVFVRDRYGNPQRVRFLLDSASQANFMTVQCAHRLRLPITKLYSSVQGIGLSTSPIRGRSEIVIESRMDLSRQYSLDVFLIDKITDRLPASEIGSQVASRFGGLFLADDQFHIPGMVDGIIGASLFPYLLGSQSVINRSDPDDRLVALQSTLGYVVMGSITVNAEPNSAQTFCTLLEPGIESLFRKFIELEDVPDFRKTHTVPEEEDCETIFTENCTRNADGRYQVALPFKMNPDNLGSSYIAARKRFFSLEKRFQDAPEFRAQYNQVVLDYLNQGHMTLVTGDSHSPSYYIPHHGIWKLDSTSTPLRVVFDASARTDKNISLNDVLHTGCKLQTDLFGMLSNFRLFEIAITADIRQMYRQIWVKEEHRRYQRILWRFSSDEPLKTYELNTVTFGVKSSPYLALRTVHQLLKDEAKGYPFVTTLLKRDLYMDDLVSTVSTLTQAELLYRDSVSLFKAGGFELVKWSTNSSDLLAQIPESMRLTQAVEFDSQELKILGLQWQLHSDTFSFRVSHTPIDCTKRNILSTVARLFDPLGFVAPVTLYAKLIIKQLWALKIDWDERPPAHIVRMWTEFEQELPQLSNFKIPRYLSTSDCYPATLVGFADACENSYGAMVYLRTKNRHDTITSTLVCAKTKVSPLKTQSIPRLELCAAYLLAKLLHIVKTTYESRITIDEVVAFSDSTVVLNWLNASPHRWKIFVANRVAKIQELVPYVKWYHIVGKDNPSDALSRGLTASQFLNTLTWISGPSWIILNPSQWPINSLSQDGVVSIEEKIVACPVIQDLNSPIDDLIARCSSWSKLLRSMVYVLRFLKIIPAQRVIVASDLERAELYLIRHIQQKHFAGDINKISRNQFPSKSLRKLRPFIEDGLLRVGGRLSNARLPFDNRHPFLLPKSDPFANLLIKHCHDTNLHTGPHLVLSILRQRYWILSARGVVRKITQGCNICFRRRPQPQFPLMGDLPACRVQQAKAFLHTGVDYTGAIPITISKNRGVKSQKAYICLFVCLVTKAIHLELVSDLSTAMFLQAFRRFLARRGPSSVMYSDCGTNFLGAKTLLDDLYTLLNSQCYNEAISDELTKRKIVWKFNPPAAPHFGGIWESQVKCVKTHLAKSIGIQILSYEELNTVLTQIEALLNSRPLSVLSSDPSEPLALTPRHFLTLTPLTDLPAYDLQDEPINRLDRFQLVDRIVQDYWKRWSREYLNELQIRERRNTPTQSLSVGTIVVLMEPNTMPLNWPLGIIEEIFPGNDGIVRVVTVKTKNGTYKRPVVKVCPLPTQ